MTMYYDAFCEQMFDCFDANNSGEYNICDIWMANNPEAFPVMADNMAYQQNDYWQNKPVDDWTNKDVIHWMCITSLESNRNYEDVKLQNFVDIDKDRLRDMSLQDWVSRAESSEDGEMFYKAKENLFKQYPYNNYDINENQILRQNHNFPQTCLEQRSRLPCSSSETCPTETPPKRKPGRPRSTDKCRKKPEKRLGKLWEFLRNLLLDDKTCPSLIKWDDYNEGTFKFVESEKVAKLWGDRKKNHKMNYEKLSRAMRYYYKSEVLLPVAGKRLVYKFGPQASGWRTANPILDCRTSNVQL